MTAPTYTPHLEGLVKDPGYLRLDESSDSNGGGQAMTDRLVERIVIAWGGKPQKDTWEEDCDYARDAVAIVIEEAAKWHDKKAKEANEKATKAEGDEYMTQLIIDEEHRQSAAAIRALAEDKP